MSLVDVKMIQNNLVGRREIVARIAYKTPLKRDEVKEILAGHFKVEPKTIIIRKINYVTGTRTMVVSANIYNSIEKIKTFEKPYILVRNNLAERPKK